MICLKSFAEFDFQRQAQQSFRLGLIQPTLNRVKKEFFVGYTCLFEGRLGVELSLDEFDFGKGRALSGG